MNDDSSIREAMKRLPLRALGEALAGVEAYLVGGVVRELVAGRGPSRDLDVAVAGEIEPVLDRLGAPARRHARFETATVTLDGIEVDLARTRQETYPAPGALPEVSPAGIEEDLARRDFTVNAMAVPLSPPHHLLDPFEGRADLEAGVLRALHDRSFVDDPTRAIRAARYCSRLDLDPDPETLGLLGATRLGDVSAARHDAELARLAAEPSAPRGFALIAEWGVMAIPEPVLALIAKVDRRASAPPWDADPPLRSRAILIAAEGGESSKAALSLAGTRPERPSEAVRLASAHQPAELLLAAAAGCEWIDDYEREWRIVDLEIDGEDLIAAGIPEGPAVGAGLRAALERKIDGGLRGGRDRELEAALEVARKAI